MRVVAISGSLRPGSTNSALVRAAALSAPEGVVVTVYEGLAGLPHFSPELARQPLLYPERVRLRETWSVSWITRLPWGYRQYAGE